MSNSAMALLKLKEFDKADECCTAALEAAPPDFDQVKVREASQPVHFSLVDSQTPKGCSCKYLRCTVLLVIGIISHWSLWYYGVARMGRIGLNGLAKYESFLTYRFGANIG